MPLHDLCRTLGDRAKWTHAVIEAGLSFRLGVLEETITDVNLIEIAHRHSDHVIMRKFSRREEGASSGADWLWCIGGPGAWLPILVQAKIVNPGSGNCNYLYYKKGDQRTKLQSFARRHRLFPVYCIYSCVSIDAHPGHGPPSPFAKFDREEWACIWVSPHVVKQLSRTNDRRQVVLCKHGVPWKYPFCEEREVGAGFAQRIAERWFVGREGVGDPDNPPGPESWRGMLHGDVEAQSRRGRIRWDRVDPRRLVAEELPSYVRYLLKAGRVSAPLSHVAVASTVPIAGVLEDQRLLPAGDRPPAWWSDARRGQWLESE